MGILDFLKGEAIQVIDWTDPSDDILVYRYPVQDAAIKMGAQLTVREGQAALFLNEGQLADVFSAGRYELNTRNLPVMTKLKSWPHNFESPFKADVLFVNMTQFTDQKWGTPNPFPVRDPEFGPVRVRAFGSYAYRVTDPAKFLTEIVGTDGLFTTDEIQGQLRSQLISAFTSVVAAAKIPVLDLAANYRDLGGKLKGDIEGEFSQYGLGLTSFVIENISLPPAVEKALDKRSEMGILGDLNKYTQFQAANAMEAAASNPSGGASQGIGLGAGLAMGQAMAAAMGGASAAPAPAPTAAPAAPAADDMMSRLTKLKTLLDAGLITQDDFDAKKADILSSI